MTNENTIKTEQCARVLPIEEAYKDDNDLVAKWKRDLCLFNFEQLESESLRQFLNDNPAELIILLANQQPSKAKQHHSRTILISGRRFCDHCLDRYHRPGRSSE